MKLRCRIFGHKDSGLHRIDMGAVTCCCSWCGDKFEYAEAHFFDPDTTVVIPKGTLNIDKLKVAWGKRCLKNTHV